MVTTRVGSGTRAPSEVCRQERVRLLGKERKREPVTVGNDELESLSTSLLLYRLEPPFHTWGVKRLWSKLQ